MKQTTRLEASDKTRRLEQEIADIVEQQQQKDISAKPILADIVTTVNKIKAQLSYLCIAVGAHKEKPDDVARRKRILTHIKELNIQYQCTQVVLVGTEETPACVSLDTDPQINLSYPSNSKTSTAKAIALAIEATEAAAELMRTVMTTTAVTTTTNSDTAIPATPITKLETMAVHKVKNEPLCDDDDDDEEAGGDYYDNNTCNDSIAMLMCTETIDDDPILKFEEEEENLSWKHSYDYYPIYEKL